MASHKPITAKELMDQLAVDPAYQQLMAKKDAELAAFEAQFADEEKVIVSEAESLGFEISSVWDFVNNKSHPVLERKFIGPYKLAYPLLIRHLQMPHHPRVREGIIRALTVRDGGEPVWKALLQEFDRETEKPLRWVLANALATAMPYRKRLKYPDIAKTYKAGYAL